MENLLSHEDYNKILQKRFNNPVIKYESSDLKPLSENMEGFMGEHYKLQITYSLNNDTSMETFFIKTKPIKNATMVEICAEINVYEKEIFFYDFLYSEFEKRGYNTSFAPKCYYIKDDSTLVMEDMASRGFKTTPKDGFYDLDTMKASLKALALFHGAGFLFEEEKQKELGRPFRLNEEYPQFFNEILWTYNDKESIGYQHYQLGLDCILRLIDFLPESEEWKEDFKTRLKKQDLDGLFNQNLQSRKTCGHGDLWCNNIMFNFEENIAKECCLVDFQAIRYFHPTFDVISIIHTNTRKEFRNKHTNTLLQFYYITLSNVLRERGFEVSKILPVTDFHSSIDAFQFLAKFQGTVNQSLTLFDEKLFTKAAKGDGLELAQIMFEDRPKFVVEYFQKYDLYREVLTEDLYELRTLL